MLFVKGKGGKKTLFTNLLVLTVGLDILKMMEHQKKNVLKQKIEASLYTFDQVSRKFYLHFTLMFQLRYYKMVQSIQKVYKSWFQKLQEFEQIQTSSGKSKKLKFDGLLSKKYIPSAKTLYTVDLSNII